jgi:hypothetical protein
MSISHRRCVAFGGNMTAALDTHYLALGHERSLLDICSTLRGARPIMRQLRRHRRWIHHEEAERGQTALLSVQRVG